MSSSVPCENAYNISIAAVSVSSLAALLGIISFFYYSSYLHKNPNVRMIQTKYDIESASWLLILSIIAGMSTAIVTIMNYRCGEKCPTATLQCNTQLGTASIALVSAVSLASAGFLKLISLHYQMAHPNTNGQVFAVNPV